MPILVGKLEILVPMCGTTHHFSDALQLGLWGVERLFTNSVLHQLLHERVTIFSRAVDNIHMWLDLQPFQPLMYTGIHGKHILFNFLHAVNACINSPVHL